MCVRVAFDISRQEERGSNTFPPAGRCPDHPSDWPVETARDVRGIRCMWWLNPPWTGPTFGAIPAGRQGPASKVTMLAVTGGTGIDRNVSGQITIQSIDDNTSRDPLELTGVRR